MAVSSDVIGEAWKDKQLVDSLVDEKDDWMVVLKVALREELAVVRLGVKMAVMKVAKKVV